MKKYLLPSQELENLHSEISQPRCEAIVRIRLLCVYWGGKGKDVQWIHEMLFIPQRTIYQYLKDYAKSKKIKPDDTNHSGRPTYLSKDQEQELKNHLDSNVYESTAAIISYIKDKYGVVFSQGGLAKWLHRQGFRYKRPKRVPYTVSVEQQEEFVHTYKEMKNNLKDDEVILFMDGVHPDHQTQHVHGWIQSSKVAQVPSTGKQKRVHYMGAVAVYQDQVEHKLKSYETINSESVKDFLLELMKYYPGKKLKIICDQGSYHKSKETKKFVKDCNDIELIYLPPRCPNLNLIERLWKMMRENVTYNRYYKNFRDFQEAVAYFFTEKIIQLQSNLLTRLRDNFHIIKPEFWQRIS